MSEFLNKPHVVQNSNVQYTEDTISAHYSYQSSVVSDTGFVSIETENFLFKTNRKVAKTGVMLVGWGGNNGSTITAAIIANKHNLEWSTKEGKHSPDYFGSLTQASTVRLGLNSRGESVYTPFKHLLPMVDPHDIVISGWDISNANLAEAMQRAQVLDYDLQRQLIPLMSEMRPLPSIYIPDFIAANQSERVDNALTGTKRELIEAIRRDIRNFREANNLDKVIVLWTANTERFSAVEAGLNDTADNLLASIDVSFI